ncbi:MAG TPA: hypothetical protein PLI43_14135 [Albidovulum sp.]|uniref:hypothetical protein n=1 Tax=Albidovulum sp. TaxID=1872424 RepID=UPI002BAD87DC|nr:hypothetical protein [Albidovulum sp.]
MANTAVHDEAHAGGAVSSMLWIAAAFVAMFSVLAINGRPLFYFDTVGYISQGTEALDKLGVRSESPLHKRNAAARAEGESNAALPETTEIDADHTVDGSRSAPYALLAGLLARMGILEGLIALNAIAVMLSVWLPMRVAQRQLGLHVSLAQMVCLPIIIASLGSLPFFVAYLMPDTMAPVLILSIATLTVFGRSMSWWELLLAVGIGAFAVVSHLSHLAIATLLVPVSVLVARLLSRDRWWLPPAFVLIILGIGFAEQSMLRTAAKEVANAEVVIKPYITARMIQDGPGFRYLEQTCPDADVPTCKLYDALMLSDDPDRLTATRIVFEKSERLGSFRLMEPWDQKLVAEDQIPFFFAVLWDAPLDTTLAFIKNTLIQSYWVSVEMTLPDDGIVAQNAGVTGLILGEFDHGRLSRNLDWLGPVTTMQFMLYAVSLLVTAGLLIWPARVPARIKALVVVLLVGILVNALVCAGISQPATRFGARVIWLLPLGATILVLFFRRSRQFYPGVNG